MPVKGIVARISYKNTFQKPGDGNCFHDKVISQVVAKLVNSHISQTHLPKLHSQVQVRLLFGRLTCIFAKSFRKGGLLWWVKGWCEIWVRGEKYLGDQVGGWEVPGWQGGWVSGERWGGLPTVRVFQMKFSPGAPAQESVSTVNTLWKLHEPYLRSIEGPPRCVGKSGKGWVVCQEKPIWKDLDLSLLSKPPPLSFSQATNMFLPSINNNGEVSEFLLDLVQVPDQAHNLGSSRSTCCQMSVKRGGQVEMIYTYV